MARSAATLQAWLEPMSSQLTITMRSSGPKPRRSARLVIETLFRPAANILESVWERGNDGANPALSRERSRCDLSHLSGDGAVRQGRNASLQRPAAHWAHLCRTLRHAGAG